MSYTYATYKAALAVEMATSEAGANFLAILPSCIDYAEQRCYRELNLLNTVQVDASTVTVAGQRTISIPQSFIVVNSMAVLTPAGSTQANGTRRPLSPVSVEVINALWPAANASQDVPAMVAMQDQWTAILGPSPDAAYAVEVVGTYRPAPLSSTDTSTFLSTYLPDLFFAASMVFMSGYMRNFGAQMNDPAMSASWEQQYGLLFKSADSEEARKHGWGASWTGYPVSPAAQPQRG